MSIVVEDVAVVMSDAAPGTEHAVQGQVIAPGSEVHAVHGQVIVLHAMPTLVAASDVTVSDVNPSRSASQVGRAQAQEQDQSLQRLD